MRNLGLTRAVAIGFLAAAAFAQLAEQTSVTIESKTIAVKYVAPTAKTRLNAAFHTDADLAFKGFQVPKGDYTLYVLADGAQWQLAINKATGARAAAYDPKLDLGRIPMTMAKAPAPPANCKLTLTRTAALAAKLEVAWGGNIASAPFHLDTVGADREW
ncbi:MAG: DUF2911 domain-containing protein [Bryobacteraceae bacterium]|jgi:hypothetical protein